MGTVFTIKLAGLAVEVRARYRSTKFFCRKYLTKDTPAVTVSISREDIRQEQKINESQQVFEGKLPARYSARYIETLALCRKITATFLPYHIVLFHGSVMAVNGKAYLFTAKSGTGKTTHCKLWLKNIPACHILNGDKPFLLFRGGMVYACGTPWQGKENYGVNEILPLKAICILERDETNHIQETSLKDCWEELLGQCHIPDGNGNFITAVNFIKQLSSVKIYRLGCNMKPEAALHSYKGMVNS